MSSLFVEPKDLEMLLDILKNFCPDSKVYAYGSRINGKAHDGSDLDLTIKNFPSDKYLFELKVILSESNVPFGVDVNIFEDLPQSFKDEIEKNNIQIM